MASFLEELRQYFENTPQEQVLANWSKYDTEENNVGPTVDEFLNSCSHFHFTSNFPLDYGKFEIKNKALSPKFSSGFLLSKNN